MLTTLVVFRTVLISRLQAFIDFNRIFSRALCYNKTNSCHSHEGLCWANPLY